jgi:hypothetical protein
MSLRCPTLQVRQDRRTRKYLFHQYLGKESQVYSSGIGRTFFILYNQEQNSIRGGHTRIPENCFSILHVTRNIRMRKSTVVQMIRFRYIDRSNVYHNNEEQIESMDEKKTGISLVS